MNNKKIIKVISIYDKKLEAYPPVQSEIEILPTFNHIRWMIKQIPQMLKDNRKEKAFRWLGFIQGVLCSEGIYTINDLKNHNKPKKVMNKDKMIEHLMDLHAFNKLDDKNTSIFKGKNRNRYFQTMSRIRNYL